MPKKTSKRLAALAAKILRLDADDCTHHFRDQVFIRNSRTGEVLELRVSDIIEFAASLVSQAEREAEKPKRRKGK